MVCLPDLIQCSVGVDDTSYLRQLGLSCDHFIVSSNYHDRNWTVNSKVGLTITGKQ